MGYPHVDWNDEWLKEHIDLPSFSVMRDEYNKTFGTNVKLSAIKNHVRLKLNINKEHQTSKRYTDEQIAWLKENYPVLGCRESLKQFNEKFNESRTFSSMKNFGVKYGIHVNENVATENKLKYGARKEGSKREMRPVGSTRLDCGRLLIKTKDGWKASGRAVYEAVHGKIPEGYFVTHLDGDTTNYGIDNLALISSKYMGLLQGCNLRSNNPEVTKTAILWCELYDALGLKKRDIE